MADELDELLTTAFSTPPENFAAGVMQRIAALPEPAARPCRARDVVEWLALVGAVAAGLSQIVAFVFGIWTISNAG